MEEEAFSGLLKVLSRLCDDLQTVSTEDQDLHLQLMAECFRAQRNACVQSTRNQSVIRYYLIQRSVNEIVGKIKKRAGWSLAAKIQD